MHTARLAAVLIGMCLFHAATLRADVKLPALISNHMAIQADKPVNIWGRADPQEKVTVMIGQDTQSATADADGRWSVKLKPMSAGGPMTMTVAGRNTIKVEDIVAGSVWVCSGQSNMAFGLRSSHNAATELPKATHPDIRLFTVSRHSTLVEQEDCGGRWVACTPETAAQFSAVGYFFGRDIHEATGRPVGLINSSWGGTPAQAWTSLSGLKSEPALRQHVAMREKAEREFPELRARTEAQIAEYNVKFAEWKAKAPAADKAALAKWEEDARKAKDAGAPAPPKPEPTKPPFKPSPVESRAYGPTTLYGGMIAPLTRHTIQGVIWYQGEANAGAPNDYAVLFPALIKDWRAKWGQGDFPFFFVQLANYMDRPTQPVDTHWARTREAQAKTLSLPNTGMAVIIDIGTGRNIHPPDKMDVGHRLSLWALDMVFGKKVVRSGPLYRAMKIEGDKARISFTEVGGGLTIGVSPLDPEAKPAAELEGFAITGARKNEGWVWAKARIEGDTVVVWSDQVKTPTAVRYAWADDPACNLYNKEGLPASPFRTDAWPMQSMAATAPATAPAATAPRPK